MRASSRKGGRERHFSRVEMVRGSRFLLKEVGDVIKEISDFFVCPLSKQPLRYCHESKSLVSDSIGVSFPIVDGIPLLVPKDGKLLEDQARAKGEYVAD